MQEILETIKTFLSTIRDVKSTFLFAVSFGSFLAGLALILITRIEPTTFQSAAQAYTPLLLVIALIAIVIAVFKLYEEKNIKTVKFAPSSHECWAHVAIQQDGRKVTQIVCDVHVFNVTDETIWLPQIKLIKPKTNAPYLNKMFMVREQEGIYHGGYEIPPRGKTDGRGHLMIDADISAKIAKGGLVFKVADQHNHWHSLKFSNVKII